MVDVDALETHLRQSVERHGLPGAVLAIADGDDRMEVAVGVADVSSGEAMTPATAVRLASITKLVTATLVLQLADAGAVDLDAPLATWLPELRLADDDGTVAATATPRHLLTHTSGIPGAWFPDLGEGDDVLAAFVPTLANVETLHPVGERFSYGNSGFILLGRIVQVVTGLTWEQAVADGVAGPLGLASMRPLAAGAGGAGVAVSHLPDPAGGVRVAEQWPEYRVPAPAGSTLAATAADVMLFLADHCRSAQGAGDGLLSPGLARDAQRPAIELPVAGTVGLAWMHSDDQRRTVGHGGGLCNSARTTIDGRFAVAFLSNGPSGNSVYAEVVAPLFAQHAGLDVVPVPPALVDEPLPSDALAGYVGAYRHALLQVQVALRDGSLVVNGAAVLQRTERADLFLSPAGLVLFQRDGDDRVAYVHAGGLTYRREVTTQGG